MASLCLLKKSPFLLILSRKSLYFCFQPNIPVFSPPGVHHKFCGSYFILAVPYCVCFPHPRMPFTLGWNLVYVKGPGEMPSMPECMFHDPFCQETFFPHSSSTSQIELLPFCLEQLLHLFMYTSPFGIVFPPAYELLSLLKVLQVVDNLINM